MRKFALTVLLCATLTIPVMTNAATTPVQTKKATISTPQPDTGTITSTDLKKLGINFLMVDNEKVISRSNTAIYYVVGSSRIELKHRLSDRKAILLSKPIKIVNGVTIFPKEVVQYLYETENMDLDYSTFNKNVYEYTQGKLTTYYSDGDTLVKYMLGSNELLGILVDNGSNRNPVYLKTAERLSGLQGLLSAENIVTPEGIEYKNALLVQLKALEQGFRNAYYGRPINYTELVNATEQVYIEASAFNNLLGIK